jgi:hypothetical protein
MKKLRFSFSALALVAGLTAAFAFNRPDPKPRFSEIWQEVDSQGQLVIGGDYFEVSGKTAAEGAFGCSGTQTPCAGQVDQPNGTLQGPLIYHF